MKYKLFTIFIVIFLFVVFPRFVFAGSAILHWQKNTDSDLAGYRVYYGTSSRSYGPYIPVGKNVSNYTLNGLVEGKTYYFALTAVDTSGNESGYSAELAKTIQGTQTITLVCESVTPSTLSSLAGEQQVFETVYTYRAGAANIKNARLLINKKVSSSKGIYFHYSVVKNKLFLRNSAGSKWLGGYLPGSSNVISNKYGSLDCSKTIVNESGDTLKITWFVTPTPLFKGTKNLYMHTKSLSGMRSGWVKRGEWTIDPGVPVAVSVAPSSSSGLIDQPQVFENVYMDPNGVDDIKYVRMLINKDLNKEDAIFLSYDLVGNKLYLRNKSNSKWLGGYAPGSQNVISNKYGMLDCSSTVVEKDSNSVRIKWGIIATSYIYGTNNLYMKALGLDGLNSDWVMNGSWTVN